MGSSCGARVRRFADARDGSGGCVDHGRRRRRAHGSCTPGVHSAVAGGASAGSAIPGGASAGSVVSGRASAGSGASGGASAGSVVAGGASAGSGASGGASAGSAACRCRFRRRPRFRWRFRRLRRLPWRFRRPCRSPCNCRCPSPSDRRPWPSRCSCPRACSPSRCLRLRRRRCSTVSASALRAASLSDPGSPASLAAAQQSAANPPPAGRVDAVRSPLPGAIRDDQGSRCLAAATIGLAADGACAATRIKPGVVTGSVASRSGTQVKGSLLASTGFRVLSVAAFGLALVAVGTGLLRRPRRGTTRPEAFVAGSTPR